MKYNETGLAEKFGNVAIEQFGNGCLLTRGPSQEDIYAAEQGLLKCEEVLLTGDYDIVIMDELTIAIYLELLDTKEVLELLNKKRPETELVVTGRYAPQELIDMADLVTDMQEVKHYYRQDVESRDGIDR